LCTRDCDDAAPSRHSGELYRAQSTPSFDPAGMKALLEVGYCLGQTTKIWARAPPESLPWVQRQLGAGPTDGAGGYRVRPLQGEA
jgi:hypothetical protein